MGVWLVMDLELSDGEQKIFNVVSDLLSLGSAGKEHKILNYSEKLVILAVLRKKTYKEIAAEYEQAARSLNNRASTLFKTLNAVLGNTKLSKHNFLTFLQDTGNYPPELHKILQDRGMSLEDLRLASQSATSIPIADIVSSPHAQRSNNVVLNGLERNPGNFVDRPELDELQRAVESSHRLVFLTGQCKTGKTFLAGKLADKIIKKQEFDYVAYYHAEYHISTLDDLYRAILYQVDQQEPPEAIDDIARVQAIVKRLRKYRCLIIIDATEKYHTNELAGVFNEQSYGYKKLLEQTIEDGHISCLIWIGCELPNISFEHRLDVAYHCQCNQLSLEAARELLQAIENCKSIAGNDEKLSQLVRFCGGNPYLLIHAARTTVKSYDGRVNDLWNATLTAISSHWVSALKDRLKRLGRAERHLLYLLVLRPRRRSDLTTLVKPGISTMTLSHAWDSLERHHLFTNSLEGREYKKLHPPLLERCAAGLFAEAIYQEILDYCAGNDINDDATKPTPNQRNRRRRGADLLHYYPLVIATAPAHQQQWQRRHLLHLVADKIKEQYHSQEHQQDLCKQLLNCLRQDRLRPGDSYAAGNLINLAGALDFPLTGFDFTGLPVRQADLRCVNLQQAILRQCHFSETIFPDGLIDIDVIALCPESKSFAISDYRGHFVRWQIEPDGRIWMTDVQQIPNGRATAMAFATDGTLAIASDNRIYLSFPQTWRDDMSDGDQPLSSLNDEIEAVQSNISCLSYSCDGELIAGLDNGYIAIWPQSVKTPHWLQPNGQIEITELAWSQDGNFFVSRDIADTCITWQRSNDNQTWVRYELEQPNWDSQYLAVGWQDNQLLQVESNSVSNLSFSLSLKIGETRRHLDALGGLDALAISENGHHLAVINLQGQVLLWRLPQSEHKVIVHEMIRPEKILIDRDAQHLLLWNSYSVQLWSIVEERCLWKIQRLQPPEHYAKLDLQKATGISKAALYVFSV
ncbi:hypothetical protein [Sphaerothrix gracilis]|uniref:hypothetical protein n=1 Tax=Sphaerothrix gracilis TaxID=3151835 RepID=UPI0031FC0C18